MTGDDISNKTGGSSGESIDYNSPYYLHPSDYPKQLHVNDILTYNNYGDWSQEMMNFLFAKNKVQFIDGTLKKPEKSSKDYMLWMRCDAMIKGWLTAAMEKNIRASVKYASTAGEIWADLVERFGKESSPRAYELKQQISVTRQDGKSVSTYYTKLRSLWDEIQSVQPIPNCTCAGCSCGLSKKFIEHQEKEKLYEFLMGLDSDFNVIKTQILATKPIPSLGTAYHLVAEDERQRNITADKGKAIETAAFKTFSKRGGTQTPNKDKAPIKHGKESKEGEHCSFYGRDGHKKEGCFKLVGYPDWWPGKPKGEKPISKAACIETGTSPIPGLSEEQYQMFVEHFAGSTNNFKQETTHTTNMASRQNGNEEWIIDSGCTEHITYRSDILENINKVTNEPPVVIPNGETVPVEGKGNYTLTGGVKLNSVLY